MTDIIFIEDSFDIEKINLFNDFEDLMSILKNLDIFITVSNSTAHIAAAMGVKTILICPKISSTYFYWSNEKNKTPWYKNVQIFQNFGIIILNYMNNNYKLLKMLLFKPNIKWCVASSPSNLPFIKIKGLL